MKNTTIEIKCNQCKETMTISKLHLDIATKRNHKPICFNCGVIKPGFPKDPHWQYDPYLGIWRCE